MKLDPPDVDLRQAIIDMAAHGVEVGTMVFHRDDIPHVPTAAIVLLTGPNTERYLQAIEEAQWDVLFIDVWPH